MPQEPSWQQGNGPLLREKLLWRGAGQMPGEGLGWESLQVLVVQVSILGGRA